MNTSKKNKLKKRKNKTIRNSSNIFIVGISGASGCGKSYFTKLLKDHIAKYNIQPSEIKIISCDSYYKTFTESDGTPRKIDSKTTDVYEKTPAYLKYNWDHPDAVDLKLLEQHLKQLKNGEDISVPSFDFNSSTQTQNSRHIIHAATVKVVIVEGLFTFYLESLRKMFDLKLFVSSDMEVCLVRRLIRDFKNRGSDYDRTITQYIDNVKPAYISYIEPTKTFADFTINNSYNSKYTTSMNVVTEYIVSKIKKR